jgi:hypothetical protein
MLVPALALVALMAWALASPVGSAPDDDFHLASIWCANSADTAACTPGSTPQTRKVPAGVHYAACYARVPTKSAACQQKYFDRGSAPTVQTDRGSFQNNYPPVFYATMSVLVGPDIQVSAVLMRLLNIVLLIAISTLMFVLLPRGRRPTLVWGWLLTIVPLGLFLIASNNPSSWAIIGVGSSWLALVGFFETTGRRRIGLGILYALTIVMAAGARGDAALYSVLGSAVAVLLTFERTRAFLLAAILPVVMSIVAIAFFFSSQQSGVAVAGLSDGSAGGAAAAQTSTLALIVKDLLNVPSIWSGVFGTWGLGWLDTGMPAIVPFGAIIALGAIVLTRLWRMDLRKGLALATILAALWLIPTYVLVKGGNEVGQNVQPRYILPLIILGVGVAMFDRGERGREFTRVQVVVVVAFLSVAESIALYFNLRRYITGVDGHDVNLNANMEWWWNISASPMLVWILGSLAFAAMVAILAREMNKANALT